MLSYIIKEIIKRKIITSEALFSLKREAALKFRQNNFVKNSEILAFYRNHYSKRTPTLDKFFEKLLRAAPIRSLSGIVSVTVLTKPYACPGNCLFCPQEKGMPKSYLKNEPAAARAYFLKFNPYLQVRRRIESLEAQGHKTDKIELIILGGTWSYYPKKYQGWFIKRCFDGANKKMSSNLASAQKLNEKAQNRIVGLTIETRPDYVSQEEIKRLRKLGVTRVELGVESTDEKVLEFNRRGHGVKQTIQATKLLKDAGFKINYHLMLDLPGSSLEEDEKMLKKIFSDSRFQPDWIKLYPTSVLKTAPLYQLWKNKDYKPYSSKNLLELIIRIKTKIPAYARITRLIRDIPLQDIIAGSEISNLRQDIQREMKKRGLVCQCIRCREVREGIFEQKIDLLRQEYEASDGKEIFLSFEDEKRQRLYALLRLRLPSQFFSKEKHFIKELEDAVIIRELHTYGDVVSLGRKNKKDAQHKGLGRKLMQEAEKIAFEEIGANKIAVIAGIGVREYYRKLGYQLKGSYMLKVK